MAQGQILEVRRKVSTGLVTACHGPEYNDVSQADMMQTTVTRCHWCRMIFLAAARGYYGPQYQTLLSCLALRGQTGCRHWSQVNWQDQNGLVQHSYSTPGPVSAEMGGRSWVYIQGSYQSLKVLEFFPDFQGLESPWKTHGPWKSLNLCLKVLESAWIWFSKTLWPNQLILEKVFQMASSDFKCA